jgi:ankyrin repeat protein
LLENIDGMGLVNKPDHVGLTPLHKAAFSGNRGCLELLLRKGGHLGMLTHSGTSVLDAVFMHIARPYHFLASILDNCVQTNNASVVDRAFKVRKLPI